jgi:Flp pilus assembly protein TadG
MRQGQLTKRDDERGAATIILVLVAVVLVGAAGLGIDTGSLAYQRSKVQHSADAGAMAIGYECVKKTANCSTGAATAYAGTYTAENSPGADTTTTVPGGVSTASTSVRVTVHKTVSTKFFGVLGVHSKNVSATATAQWTNHATSGDVIPFAVSMCEYAQAALNSPTLIESDLNDAAKDTIVKKAGIPADEAYANMAPYLAPPCAVPPNIGLVGNPSSVTMLNGGLWVVDGNGNQCDGKPIPSQVLESIETVQSYNENCSKKYGDGDTGDLAAGAVFLMAIYAPTSNYQHAGMRIDANGNAVHAAEFDMKIVGYAPFLVTGWCLGKGGKACGGDSPGATGIAGSFIRSISRTPSFEYGTEGGAFGAVEVRLAD